MDDSRKFRFLIPVFWFLALAISPVLADPNEALTNLTKVFRTTPDGRSQQEPKNGTPQTGKSTAEVAVVEPEAPAGKPLEAGGPAKTIERTADKGPTGETENPMFDAKTLLRILSALTVGGFLVFAGGYLISSFTTMFGCAVILFPRRMSGPHNFHWEYWINNDDRAKFVKKLGLPDDKRNEFASEYLAGAYHHGVLANDLLEYLMRRWNYFLIGMNCIVAYLLAILFFVIVGVFPKNWIWWTVTGVMLFAMGVNSWAAWRFTHEMTRLTFWAKKLQFLGKDRFPNPLNNNERRVSGAKRSGGPVVGQ